MHAWRMRPVRRRADDDNNWNREEVNLKLLLCTPGTRHGAGSPKARRVHPRCSPCRGTPLLVAALLSATPFAPMTTNSIRPCLVARRLKADTLGDKIPRERYTIVWQRARTALDPGGLTAAVGNVTHERAWRDG